MLVGDAAESRRAYEEIQSLTERYNSMNGGKWQGLMSAAPRELPVFGQTSTQLAQDSCTEACLVAGNACDYTLQTSSLKPQVIQMLGHSMNAVAIPKDGMLVFDFQTDREGDAVLYTAMIPTQPSDRGDLRYSVQIDDQTPVIISLKTPYRSESWKQSVLRGQALKATSVKVSKGRHTLTIKALDDHIVADQWMLAFSTNHQFYVIPVKP